MIYSYINTNKVVKEYVEDPYAIESVVYNEYCNYKSLLESCTDESAKPILEAKVKVLYEVSIKDIIDTIIKAYYRFKDWLFGILTKIVEKIIPDKNERVKEFKEKLKIMFKYLANDPIRTLYEQREEYKKLKDLELYRYTIAMDGEDENGISSKPVYISLYNGKIKENVQKFLTKYMNDFTRLQQKVFENPNKEEYEDSESYKLNSEIEKVDFSLHKDRYINYYNFNHGATFASRQMLEDFDTYKECEDTLKWMAQFKDPIKKMGEELESLIKVAEAGKEKSAETGVIVYKGKDIPVHNYAGILRFEMRYLGNITKAFSGLVNCVSEVENHNLFQYGKIVNTWHAIIVKLSKEYNQ